MDEQEDILPLSHRRLTIELETHQIRWLKALPYGMRKPLMQAIIDDLIEACGPRKFEILGAIVARRLSFTHDNGRLLVQNVPKENPHATS